jgi:hypothetical protein
LLGAPFRIYRALIERTITSFLIRYKSSRFFSCNLCHLQITCPNPSLNNLSALDSSRVPVDSSKMTDSAPQEISGSSTSYPSVNGGSTVQGAKDTVVSSRVSVSFQLPRDSANLLSVSCFPMLSCRILVLIYISRCVKCCQHSSKCRAYSKCQRHCKQRLGRWTVNLAVVSLLLNYGSELPMTPSEVIPHLTLVQDLLQRT